MGFETSCFFGRRKRRQRSKSKVDYDSYGSSEGSSCYISQAEKHNFITLKEWIDPCMSFVAKLLIMVGCVVPLMVIGAVVGVFALKAPSGELWEKFPELHTILRAGTGAVLGGSLGAGAAKIYISLNDDEIHL